MSLSFYVESALLPTVEEIIEAIDDPDVEFPTVPDGDWREAHFLRPRLRDESLRGIEIGHENGILEIRICSASNRADFELALWVVEIVAELTGADVTLEGDGAMPLENLLERCDAAWVEKRMLEGVNAVISAVFDDETTVAFDGVRRPVHVGPRWIGELVSRRDGKRLEDRLLDDALAVQNVDEARWSPASTIQVELGTGETYTFAVWTPDVPVLLPGVDRLAIRDGDAKIEIPAELGPEVAAGRWAFLDERSALVEATPASELPALVARARKHAILR